VFSRHPRFLRTSKTSASNQRLEARHEAIIEPNKHLLSGANVLDIASHDGRWSFAAIDVGAARVVGIEGRPELVQNANDNFREAGVAEHRYEFRAGELFEELPKLDEKFDVVMLLGYLYHTFRIPELFKAIADFGPSHIIVDTEIIKREQPLVRVRRDINTDQRNAIVDGTSSGDVTIVAVPSLPAIELVAETYGYSMDTMYDWNAYFERNPDKSTVGDYHGGKRVTFVLKKK